MWVQLSADGVFCNFAAETKLCDLLHTVSFADFHYIKIRKKLSNQRRYYKYSA